MPSSRSELLGYLYDVILFELAERMESGYSYNVDMDSLAGCFEHVRQMYQDDDDDEQLLEYPSDRYIRKHGLNEAEYIKGYILSLDGGCYAHFPYNVQVFEGDDSSDDSSDDDDPYGDNEYYSYNNESSESNYGSDYIVLHGFYGNQVQEFLEWYAYEVPREYHDEIAALIQGLRDDYWCNRGSGGTWNGLPNGMRGATKFSANHNDNKRDRAALRQRENEDAERRQREQEEEEERREVERREQERIWREEQRAREAREEAIRQRNDRIATYMDCLERSLMSSVDRDGKVESQRQTLQDELQQHYCDWDLEVHLFGSFASGLSSKTSDADFTVYYFEHDIKELASSLKQIGYQDVSAITNARVPIVSFYNPEYDISCDINIDEPMGVINSKLIHTYRKIDDRFLTLWFAIKQIAKRHNILSGSTGYLSSYALTMMLIVFLQDVTEPAILPRLQQQSYRMTDREVDGWDCSFDRNWSNYRTYGSDNNRSVGQLLVDFCYHYGYTFHYASQEVNPCLGRIKSRSFSPPARSRRDKRPKDWPICILDPFITGRNVAGNCHRNAVDGIQECFRSACDSLKNGDINRAFRR
jgi:DNA polymerase sigma